MMYICIYTIYANYYIYIIHGNDYYDDKEIFSFLLYFILHSLFLTNDLITHSPPLFVILHGAAIRHPNFDFVAVRFTDSFVHQPKLCKGRKERKKTDDGG